jgi:hypothetical protein
MLSLQLAGRFKMFDVASWHVSFIISILELDTM